MLGHSNSANGKNQERLLLEHIMYQANNLGNSYIFIIACINLAQVDHMKTLKSSQKIGTKLTEVLKALKVTVEGPIWYEIL